MNRFHRVKHKISSFIAGLIVSITPLSNANADDTEIFYVGETVRPQILMILDTSLSMTNRVGNTTASRLTNMKQAVENFVNPPDGSELGDIDVGLVRMNQISGAVIYPVSNLDEMVTETIHTINRPLVENHNNAWQASSNNAVTVPYISTKDANNSDAKHNSQLRIDKGKAIGMRFENITIPKGQTIESAHLEFWPVKSCGTNCKVTLEFSGEKTAHSAIFQAQTNNISNRSRTAKQLKLTSSKLEANKVASFTGLKEVIQEIVDQPTWVSGNALSLLINTSPSLDDGDTIDNSNFSGKGIKSAFNKYSPTLFIKFAPYTRTVSNKVKLLEALDEQKLTYHTPIVPTLWEATKYLRGASLAGNSSLTSNLSTTRSAVERQGRDDVHERLSIAASLKNGTFSKVFPNAACNSDNSNLNSIACQEVSLSSNSEHIPTYQSPLTDTCNDDEATMILLTDGEAHHQKNVQTGDKWWGAMTSEIASFIAPDLTCTLSGTDNGKPQTCGEELAKKLLEGISVEGLPDKKKVTLHTVGFNNTDAWLQVLARQGESTPEANARYHVATNSDDLLSVFNGIRAGVVEKTTTFSNSATSVNTANQLSHNNSLYFALFKPSDQAAWNGNLKKYQLGPNGQVLAQGEAVAVDPATGLFKNGVKDFWLADGKDPDGANILLGGAANVLPTTRKIWVNTGATTLTELSTSESEFTVSDFDVADQTAKNAVINNMLAAKNSRGEINLGDPLHSTPIEVTYGASNPPVIYYGDNQGYIHSINSTTGVENWAFIPRQLLKKQKRIQQSNSSQTHIYGMDGEIIKWKTASKTMIFSGMRRGGSSYYALDVTTSSEPKLAWIISNTTPGFEKLGQTWSTPVKTKINVNSVATDVLIFGGGYDPQQDSVNVRTPDRKGNVIYIVKALDGTLVKAIDSTVIPEMLYSIPSDIKAINIDNDSDKTADQLYVGDMGGQVIRIDIAADGSTTQGIIADLAGTDGAANRRFYHAPDISLLDNTGGKTLAVAIGSGYRANPKNLVNQDRFYMLKQPVSMLDTSGKGKGKGGSVSLPYTKLTESDLHDATLNYAGGSGTLEQKEAAYYQLASKAGWYIKLSPTEKVLASSLTIDDAIWFTSYKPATGTDICANRNGEAFIYRVKVSSALPDYKNVLPEVLENTGLDETKNCDNTQCATDDRSKKLVNTILPPRPSLLNHKGKRLIGVGTEFYPTATNKTKRMYWTEK